MASNSFQFLVLAIVATTLVPTMAMAAIHVVGDASGWMPDFDYNAWAKDKSFHVGDSLIFNYPNGKHNVVRVNGTNFKACIGEGEIHDSGNDTITIMSSGPKWYLCSVGDHCSRGQKLVIHVDEVAAPAPAPTSGAFGLAVAASSWSRVVLAAPMAIVAMILY